VHDGVILYVLYSLSIDGEINEDASESDPPSDRCIIMNAIESEQNDDHERSAVQLPRGSKIRYCLLCFNLTVCTESCFLTSFELLSFSKKKGLYCHDLLRGAAMMMLDASTYHHSNKHIIIITL
jgi:hypothetical protein